MGAAEDKLEILDLMSRYAHAADGYVAEAYADVFTEDGVAEFVRQGRAARGRQALIDFAAGRLANQSYLSRHVTSNQVFLELTSDRARVKSYVILVRNDGKSIVTTLTGVYDDVIVRTSNGWLIKERKFYSDPPPEAKGES